MRPSAASILGTLDPLDPFAGKSPRTANASDWPCEPGRDPPMHRGRQERGSQGIHLAVGPAALPTTSNHRRAGRYLSVTPQCNQRYHQTTAGDTLGTAPPRAARLCTGQRPICPDRLKRVSSIRKSSFSRLPRSYCVSIPMRYIQTLHTGTPRVLATFTPCMSSTAHQTSSCFSSTTTAASACFLKGGLGPSGTVQLPIRVRRKPFLLAMPPPFARHSHTSKT